MSENHQRPEVKICGLTRPEDIVRARELGADFFGVIGYAKSPRGVPFARATELLAEIPAGRAVYVDVAPEPERLRDAVEAGFGACQVHFDPAAVPADLLAAWREAAGHQRLWLAPRIPGGESFPEHLLDGANTFLVDTFCKDRFGGTGHTGDWSFFRETRTAHSEKIWVLAGGLSPENLAAALAATGARRVDLNSGVESAPGKKDDEKLRAAFAVITAVNV